MKKLITLLLLLTSLAAISQPQRTVKHVILIRNNRTGKFIRISENARVSIRTTSGAEISGKILLIRADTLRFRDTLVLVASIDSLFLQDMPSRPNPFAKKGRKPVYTAGNPKWQIICPPDDVYKSPWSYKIYFTQVVRHAKYDLREAQNPLQEEQNPLHAANNLRRDTVHPRHYANFLKWNITKLAHLEIALSYERLIADKLTWETELSAIFGVQSADAYYQIPQPLYNYNGFSVTTYPKFYILNSTTYLSMVFMYRYLWATGIRTGWPDSHENGELQDQYRNDIGLSIRIGIMKRYGIFVVDYYFGGGVKYIMLHQLVYGSYLYHDSSTMRWYHEDHSPDVFDRVLPGLVINLGIKIGFAF